MAIGSRLKRGSRVVRGPKREFISRVATARDDLRGIARMRRTVPALPLPALKARLGRTVQPPRVMV